jgi:hypothetical protein
MINERVGIPVRRDRYCTLNNRESALCRDIWFPHLLHSCVSLRADEWLSRSGVSTLLRQSVRSNRDSCYNASNEMIEVSRELGELGLSNASGTLALKLVGPTQSISTFAYFQIVGRDVACRDLISCRYVSCRAPVSNAIKWNPVYDVWVTAVVAQGAQCIDGYRPYRGRGIWSGHNPHPGLLTECFSFHLRLTSKCCDVEAVQIKNASPSIQSIFVEPLEKND